MQNHTFKGMLTAERWTGSLAARARRIAGPRKEVSARPVLIPQAARWPPRAEFQKRPSVCKVSRLDGRSAVRGSARANVCYVPLPIQKQPVRFPPPTDFESGQPECRQLADRGRSACRNTCREKLMIVPGRNAFSTIQMLRPQSHVIPSYIE